MAKGTVVVLAILALAWAAREGLSAVAASHKPDLVAPPPIAVKTVRLAPETLTRPIRYSGTVKEWQRVDVSFRVSGVVDGFHRVSCPGGGERDVQEGDRFPKGTILARLDTADYRLERALAAERLAQAEAKLASSRAEADNARRDYERNRRIVGTAALSQSDYDAAAAKSVSSEATARAATRDVEANRVQLAQADTNLAYCTLTMPYDEGTLSARYVEAGERVTAGQKAFQIMDLSSVRISFGVPDSVVGRLAPGSEVVVTTDALPDERFRAVITKIAPTADTQTRTYLIEVRVSEPRGLRPGMVATAAITKEVTACLLPLVAITRESEGGRLVAYKLVGEGDAAVVRPCPVELDGVIDNRAVIRMNTAAGLCPGDEVAVAGTPRLFDGAKVKVIGK